MRPLQTPLADKTHIDRMRSLVARTFVLCQIDAHTLGAILGKLLPQERLEALRIDNRSDQLIESPAFSDLFVLFGIGRSQSQAERGGCHECCFSPGFSR